jgi:hypothetical protein
MDFPFSFLSTLVGIIAHDKAIRSCRVHSWNIGMAITPGTVTVLQIADVKAPISGVNRRRLRPAGKRAISIGDCTDPGD